MLTPAALGGLALLCAAAAWFVIVSGAAGGEGLGGIGTGGDGGGLEAVVLGALVTLAAAAAAVAAVLLRRWDLAAGREVARERAAKASMGWRAEERQAELEESRELVETLESKIRDKRAELGRLRSEHAALLRRYATAESERAKALEGRRQLALEGAAPAKALPAQAADHRTASGAPTRLTYLQAREALSRLSRSAARQREAARDHAQGSGRGGRSSTGGAGEQRHPHAPQQPQPEPSHPSQAPQVVPPPRPRQAVAPQHGAGFDFFGAAPRPPHPRRSPHTGPAEGTSSGRGAPVGQE